MAQQFAFRSQKSLGLVGGSPDYESLKGFESPPTSSRSFIYSTDGRLFAYILPDSVRIHDSENGEVLRILPLSGILEAMFSPRGTYMMTWERQVKQDDDSQHKNLRLFSVSTGEELITFPQKGQEGWALQFTISESHAVRLVGQEIHVYHPTSWNEGIVDRLKVEGLKSASLSPGLNPSLAVFVAEKNGKPANIRIYTLLNLSSPPTCQKSTFRAEHASFKWNTIGTQVLCLVRTDVDATNRSYYGETRLYLLTATGSYDSMVPNLKEGPVHDFCWSPNSKEFAVVSGYTPSRTVILDGRAKVVHDFGTSPNNFISFNPQGRLIALAGFGNMSNPIHIYDRRSLDKVASIDAPNTTSCDWAPDGRFLFTATLSPRLRVDNGIKIWHCSGLLLHVQLLDELYQVAWRPTPVDNISPFPASLPAAPPQNPSVSLFTATAKQVSTKPVGAYRPPGARGTETPSYFKRRDGVDDEHGSGTSTPARYGRSPVPGAGNVNGSSNGNGHSYQGNGKGRRHVPGAAASPSPIRGGESEKKGKSKKKDGKKKDGANPDVQGSVETSEPQAVVAAVEDDIPQTPGVDSAALDAMGKKIRNLTKKLKAIEELKEKQKRGERLETTQLSKITTEVEIRNELAQLAA